MRFRLRPTIAALAAGSAAAAVSAAFASAATGPGEAEMLVKIADTTAISDLAYREDAYLSDVIGPRLSGSSQDAAAVAYVADRMRALGLAVRLEPVMVPDWVRGEESASLVNWAHRPAGDTQKIVVTALGTSVATPPQGITAPVVVVHGFDELATLGARVRGAIVLYDVPFDKRLAAAGEGGDAYGKVIGYRSRGPSAAAKLGAVASLVRSLGSADDRLPHTGLTHYAAGIAKIPAGAVTTEDAELIARLAQRGPVTMHLTLTPRTLPDAKTDNVIADLPGTGSPACSVIVSGHLDSWDLGTGATDDGAGVAEAMSAMATLHDLAVKRAARFASSPMRTRRAANAAARRTRATRRRLGTIVVAIESDSGAAMPIGFGTSLSAAAAPALEPIAAALRTIGAPVIEYGIGSETDVEPLALASVPVFAPVQHDPKYFDYHHTAADTFDKLDKAGIAQNAAVLATLAYGLSQAAPGVAREPYGADR